MNRLRTATHLLLLQVYKAAQSGRLKEHIATKHKDEAAQEGDAVGGGSKPAPAAAPPPSAASSSNANRGAASSSKPAGAEGPSRPSSAAPSAPSKGGGGSGAGPSAPAASKQPQQPASAAAGGMMDVNSKAGYYTHKSPKMHLAEVRGGPPAPHTCRPLRITGTLLQRHEFTHARPTRAQWCQREARLRPRITQQRKGPDNAVTYKASTSAGPGGPWQALLW